MSKRVDDIVLLAVTAALGVIFVLWVLLPPQPRGLREAARQATCVSNMKQLGMAAMQYAQDYDGSFPPKSRWCDALTPYLKSVQVLKCPSAKDQRSGYAYFDGMPLTKAACRDPQRTVMLFDAIAYWNTFGNADIAAARHRGMMNVGFADGHVKSYSSLPIAKPE